VPALWRTFYLRGFEVTFAHRTFAWSSEARGTAHVHCVVVGFAHAGVRPGARALYEYPDITELPSRRQSARSTATSRRAFDDRRTAKCAFRFELADRFIRFDAQ